MTSEHRARRACSLYRRLCVAGALALLAGCEAPLELDGVNARRSEPIRRSDLFQQAATNGRALVVVGNHGLVLRSQDAGAAWERQELPGWPSLIDVAACPDGTFAALAAEGLAFVSGDDGRTWTETPIPTEESPQGITCDPADRLWVVGSFSTIVTSADRGQSWDDRSFDEDTILTTIQFIDADTAVVFGEFGVNFRSTDGGASWTPGEPLPNDFYSQEALFIDAQTGWVAGLAGEIRHTTDAGRSWTLQETPSLAPIYGLAQTPHGIYAVGGEGLLLRLGQEGWERIEYGRPVRLHLRIVLPVGGERLLIGGAAGELHVVSVDRTGKQS